MSSKFEKIQKNNYIRLLNEIIDKFKIIEKDFGNLKKEYVLGSFTNHEFVSKFNDFIEMQKFILSLTSYEKTMKFLRKILNKTGINGHTVKLSYEEVLNEYKEVIDHISVEIEELK